uniref:NADH-ubiquinone oxidoreductase chain 5 n=1 Tax=Ptiliidae sp. BMNH 1274726 TaxID=1796538 RepID=A0A126TGB1_9COLE|nr:NADH dehydrogenase subunit 5 [Ptiliidae sp. BMNH 1274726]
MFILSLSFFILGLNFLMLNKTLFMEFEFLNLNSISLEYIVLFDWMSLIFMSFVLFISSMVLIYSVEYMGQDLNLNRFIFLVIMFVLSMMFMIISPNLVSILLGWDGLGLVSYCLVIYYQSFKSFNAGMLTALSNRVGDVALLLSISCMFHYGSYNFMFYSELLKMDLMMFFVMLLVIIAAFTKSAQIPFSSWLPAAMAAPTPVSSLVHSSTLVTAGVYLLIRFNSVFSGHMIQIFLVLSILTMFMAGLGANFEFDLKKIIALSTLSQLGLMMSILFLGSYKLAFYHLLTHALFKALLFMCAGSFIHSFYDMQDIRYMGNIYKYMPFTSSMFMIANFSLCGFPFLSGFYSKDLILEMSSLSNINFFLYLLFFISTGLTVSYSVRLSYYLFFSNMNFYSYFMISDSSLIMLKSKILLVLNSIFMGCILNWLIMDTPLFIYLPLTMKLMTLFVIIVGSWLGYEISLISLNFSNKSLKLYYIRYFALMWNLPMISTIGVNNFFLSYGSQSYKILDQGWYELFGYFYLKNYFFMLIDKMENLMMKNFKIMLFLLVFFCLII